MTRKLYGLLIVTLFMSFGGVAFALTPMENLGKLVYEDTDFSFNQNQSCQSCHHPKAQFSDPVNRISPMYRPVSEGSHAGLFGGRNAPPAAYAAYSPTLHWNDVDGLFIGGLFWDGRASGLTDAGGRTDITATGNLGAGPTGDPLADQAKGPFGNPVEMALLNSVADVVALVESKYPDEYFGAWGTTPNLDGNDVAYNKIALAISAFEKSNELNKFSSKFDDFRAEQELLGNDLSTITVGNEKDFPSDVYTDEEKEGLALFNTMPNPSPVVGGGGCFLCHPVPGLGAPAAESVFTDFSYDNLGVPINPVIAELAGPQPIDFGLESQAAILDYAYQLATGVPLPNQILKAQKGKFKVSSLRNVARTAPYAHNGFFPTLYDIVHFYNTRDVLTWPAPEVGKNVNKAELGNLGLTFEQEQKIVVFLETLTDN